MSTTTNTTDATGQLVITFSDLVEGDELRSATERRTRERALAGVALLVVIGLGLGFAAACFAGCATITDESVTLLDDTSTVVQGVLTPGSPGKSWETLTDAQKRKVLEKCGRTSATVLHDAKSVAIPAIFSSPPATSDAITLPSSPSK